MKIYAAIDIMGGKCVRLTEGRKEQAVVYYDDPVEAAKMWVSKGAEVLHVIDLDGAFNGKRSNTEIIKRIIREAGVPVQVGGGIRTISDINDLLDDGADRVIIGTAAVVDDEVVEYCSKKNSNKVVVSVDCKDGFVAIDGWVNSSRFSGYNFARKLVEKGLKNIIYTDVRRDGTLKGPDFDGINKLCSVEGAKVIASGGVKSLEDIKKLKESGVTGVIIGSALYKGAISLEEALLV